MSEGNFCSNCGAKLKKTDQFCANCGSTVGTKAAQPVQPVEQPATQPVEGEAPPPAVYTPPTKEEKNKLILLMVVSIIIPIVGIVIAIIRYNKQDKKSGLHYLMCGLSGIAFALGGAYWVGFVLGAVLIASTVYTGLQSINKGEISLEI